MEPSFTYSIPYVIFAFCLGLLSLLWHFGNERAKRWSVGTAIALFLIFIGLRGLIMSDWIFYYYFFKDHCTWDAIVNGGIAGEYEKVSTAFGLYNLFFKTIFDNWYFFAFCHLSIEMALLFRFFKHNSLMNIPLVLMLFYCLEGNVILCNLLRNGMSMFLCLNALEYIRTREFGKFLIWILLGVCFHYTAIIFLFLYFIVNIRLNRYWFAGFIVVANVIYLLKIPITASVLGLFFHGNGVFSLMFEQYTEMIDSHAGAITFGYLEKLITSILVFLYYDELKASRKDSSIYLNAIMLYLFIFLAFAEFGELSKRISALFMFGYWVIWYDMIGCFKYSNNRYLFSFCIGIFCLFRLANGCKYADYEYDNALFGPKSDVERYAIREKVEQYEDAQK